MTFDQLRKHYGIGEFDTDMAFKLASACNVRTQSIYNWRRTGIPRSRQLEVQEQTGGKLRADKPKRNGK